jgi:hypothetical protein
MLQEVLDKDDFLEVSSARRLVNISGTVRAIVFSFAQVKDMGLMHIHIGLLQRLHYYGGRNWI